MLWASIYDFPVAVNEVLEEKGAKNLQIMVHCVSSVTFFMSLLSGQLEGKIRSVVASKVAFCTVPSKVSWLKAHTKAPNVLHSIGVQGLNTYTEAEAGCICEDLL